MQLTDYQAKYFAYELTKRSPSDSMEKLAGARRVLFLVDRGNLGDQTLKEFQQFVTPDDGRKFTELYNVTCNPRSSTASAASASPPSSAFTPYCGFFVLD